MCADLSERYPIIADEAERQRLLSSLNGWKLTEAGKLNKVHKFTAFNDGLEFVNRVAKIADQMDHHPDVSLSWGKVELTIFTHCKNSLTKTDFELAEKIDRL